MSTVTSNEVATPERARVSARRWFIGAVVAVLSGTIMYFSWRPGWEAFKIWFSWTAWLCLVRWSNERGFIRGWNIGRKTGS